MQNPKTGGSRIVPDTRTGNITTYTETHTPEGGTQQSAEYKIVNAPSIINSALEKLSFLRTHVAAVWYNKLAGITLKQKLDEVDGAVGKQYSLAGGIPIPSGADLYDAKYRIPGNYYCSQNSVSSTLINCPVAGRAFTMKVDYSAGTSYPRQTFKVFANSKIVTRTYDTSANKWFPEDSYVQESDLLKNIQLIEETVTMIADTTVFGSYYSYIDLNGNEYAEKAKLIIPIGAVRSDTTTNGFGAFVAPTNASEINLACKRWVVCAGTEGEYTAGFICIG